MSLSFRSTAAAIAAAVLLCAPEVAADIHQPDPMMTLIPHISSTTAACTTGLNVQACLDDSEQMLGGMVGAVSAIHQATINRETFNPQCQLTFKVLSKGGSVFQHVFGWYPAKGGDTPPPLSDLHVFLNCQDCQNPGTMKTLTLPAGVGAIGFFEASYRSGLAAGMCPPAGSDTLSSEPSDTMYTERRFNGKLRNGMPNPDSTANYIRVLAWQSVAQPGSFYFGWEDDGSTYSDNNFNDLVTWVSGISCSGGGTACDTGMKGQCANGRMQCRAGALSCVPTQTGVPEKCNAIDDNCDGNIDEGDLCPSGFVCYRGTCVPNCGRGEFMCTGDRACEVDAGVCVDLQCRGKTCPAGQVCQAGNCVGECVGVKCPYGQACQHGGCVDVCALQKCDNGFDCTVSYPDGADRDPVGICSTCGCQGCGATGTCAGNHCVPNDCAKVTCAPGTHCQSGMCVDNCAGTVCPPGQKCAAGACVGDGSSGRDGGGGGSTGAGGASTTGGPPILTTGSATTTTTGSPGTTSTTAGSGSTGSGGAAGGQARTGTTSGCNCHVPGRGSSPAGALVVALFALAGISRRRR